MSVQVVIPYHGSNEHRIRALAMTLDRISLPVTMAWGGEPWCKAAAVMPVVEASSADIVVVHDADVYCPLDEAIAAVQAGASWAVPHDQVLRLSEAGTEHFEDGKIIDPFRGDLTEAPYRGVAGGGIVIARRDVILEAPMDQRFIGWGQEDEAWAVALTALFGDPWRGGDRLAHFWHPPMPRVNRRRGNTDGWALFRRYAKASRDEGTMRALLAETRGGDASGYQRAA